MEKRNPYWVTTLPNTLTFESLLKLTISFRKPLYAGRDIDVSLSQSGTTKTATSRHSLSTPRKTEILADPYVHEGLFLLKEEGLVNQIGASTYTREELSYVISKDYFDWIQVACNLLDNSQITVINNSNAPFKVAARSVFLQGVLLAEKSNDNGIPRADEMRRHIATLSEIASENGLSLSQLATSFVVNHCDVDMVLFGAGQSLNIKAFHDSSEIILPNNVVNAIQDMASKSKCWTNPKKWETL